MAPDKANQPVNQHLVSKGYQKNFATPDQRLAIVATGDGAVVDARRPTKRNWVEQNWNSIQEESGYTDSQLEHEWSRVEAGVMRRIREVAVGECTPQHRTAIVNLFAVHLVRSKAFAEFHDEIRGDAIPRLVSDLVADPETSDAFVADYGRDPTTSELETLVGTYATNSERSGRSLVEAMTHQHNSIAEKLIPYHVQVVQAVNSLPGFVLGDVPVVHASLASGRFGFRDRLAIGDADLLIAPLTRRIVVCFTATRRADVRITTKRKVREINAIFVRAALDEVACHPDDLLETQRLVRNLPPARRP